MKLSVSLPADDYAAAWDEWQATGEEAVWVSTVGDGIVHAAG